MKKTFFYFLTATILSFSATNNVFATIPQSLIKEYYQNNIYWYNPGYTEKCLSDVVNVYGDTIEEKIWTGLTNFLSDEQAAGVMSNIYFESGFNPARHETALLNRHQPGFKLDDNANISYGLGLIQWSFGRRIRLYNYIKETDPSLLAYLNDYETYGKVSGAEFLSRAGDSVTNHLIAIELQFLKDELTSSSVYNRIFQQTTVADAASFFSVYVEGCQSCRVDGSSYSQRVGQADDFFNTYNNSVIFTKTSSGCYLQNSLATTVLSYAWPEWHAAPYVERTKDYAEAVTKRINEGRYVGGSVNGVPGIDCGGFVTTLMQESGFEPEYNNSNGATGTQEAWVNSHGWTRINNDGAFDTSSLQPGDVAFTDGHTYVYIGEVEGFEYNIASASYSTHGDSTARAPMAGRESLTGNGVRWYRKGNQ